MQTNDYRQVKKKVELSKKCNETLKILLYFQLEINIIRALNNPIKFDMPLNK